MDEKKKYSLPEESTCDPFEVISSNDCTGLVPASPHTDAEAESYMELYKIPNPKSKKRYD